jgi:phosphoenolpyruvate synthase/pyruvate phosphate dikinase/NAD(P)-dependent dehydrogenase (short-subunit alcohol dehydrogenase family)
MKKTGQTKSDNRINALKGKVAVITGGSRGLGLMMARAFGQAGAAVVIASRSASSVDGAVCSLRAEGLRISGMVCDVTNLDQVQALGVHAVEQFGGLDIWVNNAGISSPIGPTIEVPSELFQSSIQINIMGTYHGSLVAMQHFLPQGKGKLINLLGMGAGKPTPMHNPYSSSKTWIRVFTLSMAKEYQDSGVGVFLFNPGIVETEMTQHLQFIDGYQGQIKIFKVVTTLFANPPEVPLSKAVWLASPATDNRTGLQVNVIGMGGMLKGVFRYVVRRLTNQVTTTIEPSYTLIKPALGIPQAGNPSIKSGRGFIVGLNNRNLPESIGNKAANIYLLKKKHFRVPETFVCTWEANLAYRANSDSAMGILKNELEKLLKPGSSYAIRSSANIEDSVSHSFAGQFDTFLNVVGVDQVLQAIIAVWNSVEAHAAQSYLVKSLGPDQPVKMSVIIQKMVNPIFSGVAFSKNPVTGLDEIVVEAVQGIGTALVQDGVTPYRWVNKWGQWIAKPDGGNIPLQIIQKVVDQTKQIAHEFKKDVDLEWVFDGEQLYWLQMRDITTLGNTNTYSNRMSKEMTPGIIKPLVWSVTVPIPAGVWIGFFKEVIGKIDISPANLMKAFYYRAYHNIGTFGRIFDSMGMPRQSLEMMLGVAPPGMEKPRFRPTPKFMKRFLRMLGFGWDKWTFSKKAEVDYSLIQAQAQKYTLQPSPDLTERQLLGIIDELTELNQKSTYNTILSILLMQFYNRILQSRLERLGIDFHRVDLTDDMPEIRDYDPNIQLENLNRLFHQLDPGVQEEIRHSDYKRFVIMPGIEELQNGCAQFLKQYGHLSDSGGDFGSVPWRETPDLILKVIADFKKSTDQPKTKIRFQDLKIKGIQKPFLSLFYHRARQFRLLREKHSSLYTYTLMLFRVYYIAVGDRLVQHGMLEDREDIYYLYDSEIRALVDGQETGEMFSELVSQRKSEMEQYRDIVLPEVIYGDVPPPIMGSSMDKLTGTPTSRGYYTGKVKVVRSLADFSNMQPGAVLVIPYSDVGWTPLFLQAGGVISESGGMLSHSSIIAREYGIPAVVSVPNATQLPDGAMVTVDGFLGEVLVHLDE